MRMWNYVTSVYHLESKSDLYLAAVEFFLVAAPPPSAPTATGLLVPISAVAASSVFTIAAIAPKDNGRRTDGRQTAAAVITILFSVFFDAAAATADAAQTNGFCRRHRCRRCRRCRRRHPQSLLPPPTLPSEKKRMEIIIIMGREGERSEG